MDFVDSYLEKMRAEENAAKEERSAVVAFLRDAQGCAESAKEIGANEHLAYAYGWAADAIEAREHLESE